MAENRPPIALVTADGTRLGVYADYTKNVKETMPAASAEYADVSVLYVGSLTSDFTPGHIYTCVTASSGYMWLDVTPTDSDFESGIVSEVTFTTDSNTGDTVTLTKAALGVVNNTPEYDIIDAAGYNITADVRLSRKWDSTGYVLTYLGGWPTGTWTAKSVLGNTYTKVEIDRLVKSSGLGVASKEVTSADWEITSSGVWFINIASLGIVPNGCNITDIKLWKKEGDIYSQVTDFTVSQNAEGKTILTAESMTAGKLTVTYVGGGVVNSGFASAEHEHAIDDVFGLQTSLDRLDAKIDNRATPGVNYPMHISSGQVSVVVTREALGCLNDPELDLLDPSGYNISGDSRLTRRWTTAGYELTMQGGFTSGIYTLKCVGGVSSPVDRTVMELSGSSVEIDTFGENTYYICTGNVTSMIVNKVVTSTKESILIFTTGDSFTAAFPASVEWATDVEFEPNSKYVLVCNYGIMAASKVSVR